MTVRSAGRRKWTEALVAFRYMTRKRRFRHRIILTLAAGRDHQVRHVVVGLVDVDRAVATLVGEDPVRQPEQGRDVGVVEEAEPESQVAHAVERIAEVVVGHAFGMVDVRDLGGDQGDDDDPLVDDVVPLKAVPEGQWRGPGVGVQVDGGSGTPGSPGDPSRRSWPRSLRSSPSFLDPDLRDRSDGPSPRSRAG